MIAVVCPGQGSQTPGFLAPWLDLPGMAEQLGSYSEAVKIDLIGHGTLSDAATIRDTAVAQPLIVAAGLLGLRALREAAGGAPLEVTAGHSVGEITAAAASGVLDEADALRFVALRACGMAEASAVAPTGMSAVLGGDPDEVTALLAQLGLTGANRNGAGQVVAAGTLAQLQALAEAPPAKARVVALQVAGAFHTSHMAPAVPALEEFARGLDPADASVTLLSNADGQVVRAGGEVLTRLVRQVVNPVRWDLCMATLVELGVTTVVELPPAGTLANLAKRAMPGVTTVAVKTPDDLPKAVAALTAGAPA